MDREQFLQYLRDHSLEDGYAFIREHIDELSDHAATGNWLEDEALHLLYTPFISLKIAELLVFFGDYVSHTSSHALGLKAKGDALMMIGHYQAALDAADAAGTEFRALGDERNWARSRICWVYSATLLGRIEEALEQAQQARNIFFQLNEPFWVCTIDHNTALIYQYMGRYQDAINLYEQMLAIYSTVTGEDKTFIERSIALARMNQAYYLALLGNFQKAYQLQLLVQPAFLALGETELAIASELNVADYDYAQGYYGSALRRYYQAHDSILQHHIENPVLLIDTKRSTARCLLKLNRAQEASKLAAEVVAMERQAGESLYTVLVLNELATTLSSSGRLEEAMTILDEALAICNQRGFDHQATIIKLDQAELLLKMQDVATAYTYAQTCKDLFVAQGLVSNAARATLVMVEATLQNLQDAIMQHDKVRQSRLQQEIVSLCQEIIEAARQYNLQEEVYRSYYLSGRMWLILNNPEKAGRYFKAAIAQIERILDDLVYDLSPSFMHTEWAVYADMIALCLSQGKHETALDYLEQARSIALRQYLNKSHTPQVRDGKEEETQRSSTIQPNSALLLRLEQDLKDWQEKYRHYNVLLTEIDTAVSPSVNRAVIQAEMERCETQISETFERLHLSQSMPSLAPTKRKRTLRHVQPFDVARLQQHLAPDQLLLAYFLHQDKLVIFAVTPTDLIMHEIADGAQQLERLLPLLRAHLDPRGWPDPHRPSLEVVRRLLSRLYTILVKPVATLLPPPSGLLTIVPYGPLHALPFHALFDGQHHLIENFQVHYFPTSSLLLHLVDARNNQHQRNTGTQEERKRPLVFGYSESGYLQRVKDEAQTIASLLDGICYLEDDATIARLTEYAPGSPIIHLATHGQSRPDAPNFSYVRLADGQLNAIDAFSLDLNKCELVTLSGCETGLALIGGGDELFGLGRAFLAAGATSLVMSLWTVEDNATNELMKLFYSSLLRKGESKVQALRAAQCQLMQYPDATFAHPYFWSAFRLVGDPTPLKYPAHLPYQGTSTSRNR